VSETRRSCLTGSWSGAYRYPRNAGPETVFNAQIDEVGGAFVGSIEEPNVSFATPDAVLTAQIEGVRDGISVVFTKFYDHAGIRHAVRYEGAVDANLARIEGKWIIHGAWSGAFFMTRDDEGDAARAERTAEQEVEIGT
jgi:hypothetical protein